MKKWLAILGLTIIPVLIIWIPFFLRVKSFFGIPLPTNGMATIVANYDGPLYILVAKSFYDPQILNNLYSSIPSLYFAAHFPLFPLIIRVFSIILGYPYALLLATILSSYLAIYFFYRFVYEFVDRKNAFWLTFIFSIFPARWLIVRSIGSADPLFVALIIASIFYFKKENYLISGLFGFMAQFTKSPGILLFAAYFLYFIILKIKELALLNKSNHWKKGDTKKLISIILIPLAIFIVFTIYKFKYNDFWAYFHSGDNIHLFFPPFQIFNSTQPWVGTFWLEEIIFIYLFGAYTLVKLIIKKEMLLSWFVGIFFASTLFVSHRDLIRYSLPLIPFFIISFSDTLMKKEFKYVLIFILLPIFLFSLSFISQNTMPIPNWSPFL